MPPLCDSSNTALRPALFSNMCVDACVCVCVCVCVALPVSLSLAHKASNNHSPSRSPISLRRMFVVIFSTVFCLAIVLSFGVLKANTLGAGFGWFGVFILVMAFQVGARSLLKAMHKPGVKMPLGLQRIATMAKHSGILLLCFSISVRIEFIRLPPSSRFSIGNVLPTTFNAAWSVPHARWGYSCTW